MYDRESIGIAPEALPEILPATAHDLFSLTAARVPDRTALVFDRQRLTYRDLETGANQLAHHLRALGVTSDILVAICLERSIELLAGILGILKAGGAYVPMDPNHPIERLQYILADSQAPVLVTRAGLRHLFADYPGTLLLLDETGDAIAREPSETPAPTAGPENLMYVMYTSGSTGHPKGVMIEHRNVVNSLAGHQERYPAGPDDAYLFKTNHAFDPSVLEIFGAWWHGGRLVVLPPGDERDPAAIMRTISRHGVTHLFSVPSTLQLLLDVTPPRDLDLLRRLKYVLVGGEAFSRKLGQQLLALGGPVRFANIYGPTETTIFSTGYLLNGPIESVSTPIGTPFFKQTAYLLDDRRQRIPADAVGAIGEMYIGGASVARGYLHAPELTRDRFVDDPFAPGGRMYRTGDLCRHIAGGQLEFVERVDHQIKIWGHRVELGEIESVLASHPAIAQAVVTAAELHGEPRLIAYFVARDPAPSPSELRAHLQHSLPDHMIPAAWRRLDALPLNANGKVDRKALPPVDTQPDVPPNPMMESASDLMRTIADVWATELGVAQIGPDDDFFELGGHSLSAARVAAQLRTRLRKDLTPGDVHRAPTIRAFESLLTHARNLVDVDRAPAPAGTGGAFPLAYQQLDLWLLAKIGAPHLNVAWRKRVAGRLDRTALSTALSRVVADHPLLRSRMGAWVPRQSIHASHTIDVDERDISHLSAPEKEEAALTSMREIEAHSTWASDRPLLQVRLLRLDAAVSELQVCIPHIVADEASMKIFFDDLSAHYLDMVEDRAPESEMGEGAAYETYVREERAALGATLKEDTLFWEQHLDDARPIRFPENDVLPSLDGNTSLGLEWPAGQVETIEAVARSHRLGMSDVLYALVLSAVAPYVQPAPDGAKPTVFYAPRSTRSEARYDRSIGLFARLDCLKADVADVSDLLALARRVRQARMDTDRHQGCPMAVKSAGLHKARWRKMAARDLGARLFARALVTLLRPASLNYEVVVAQARLLNLQRAPVPDFALFVNVTNSFVDKTEERALFGHPLLEIVDLPPDDAPMRRVLKIHFLREPNRANRPVVELHGDLSAAFRRELGERILENAARLCATA
jgi:amino acid adenylation domain-containing protein